ncbi:MAG: VCBS repeat-containing protein, partial [Acidobacteriota bacterium]
MRRLTSVRAAWAALAVSLTVLVHPAGQTQQPPAAPPSQPEQPNATRAVPAQATPPVPSSNPRSMPLGVIPASRPRDVNFRMQMIDSTGCETVGVADVNRDSRLDLIACEYWYEAPAWTPHKIRDINFNGTYVDNFSDLPLDVDDDGFVDVIQIAYFDRRILWLKNPGRSGGAWTEHDIDRVGPVEFAFLVDLNNDGKANELLPQFTGAAQLGTQWYEVDKGHWTKHVVSTQHYGHGIGVGDLNGDRRNDIITPTGWLEAPANVTGDELWVFHETDWSQLRIQVGPTAVGPPGPAPAPSAPAVPPRPAEFGFMHVLDVNADGRNDIVTTMAHSYGVLWFEQLADGRWMQRLIDNTWAQSHASAVGDVNGDGQPDFVTGKRYWARSAAS